LVKDISQGWVLELVHRYPSAALLGAASAADLDAIAYLPGSQIEPLLQHARTHARTSIASLCCLARPSRNSSATRSGSCVTAMLDRNAWRNS
jgi:hypothetical protein